MAKKFTNTSFIAVSDFEYNAKKLAAYVHYLDKNHTAYMEFFQWQKYYSVLDDGALLKPACDLCRIISEGKHHMIKGIPKWYVEDAHCERPRRFTYDWL